MCLNGGIEPQISGLLVQCCFHNAPQSIAIRIALVSQCTDNPEDGGSNLWSNHIF